MSQEEREDKNGSCNWADHGHPRLPNFPAYLPLKLFIDETGKLKKDGDEVVFYYNDTHTNNRLKIILTLNQRDYRYGWCGTYVGEKEQDGGFDNCIRACEDFEKLVKPYLSK